MPRVPRGAGVTARCAMGWWPADRIERCDSPPFRKCDGWHWRKRGDKWASWERAHERTGTRRRTVCPPGRDEGRMR